MAGRIFTNYRRGDDPGNTGRLFDRLQETFAPEQLFIDVDNIPPGLDFIRVLEEQVSQCDALLVVIGPRWLDAADPQGKRRLDSPDDFVRIEIESALTQGKRVIPVLVGDARMPAADELPETMRLLARRNAVRLTYERFRADTQGLIKALQQALEEVAAARAQEETTRRAEEEEKRAREVAAASERARASAEAAEQARLLRPPKPRPVWWLSWEIITVEVVAAALLGLTVWVAFAPAPPAPATVEPAPVESAPPKDTVLKDCADCPDMVVMPAGSFTMGSPASEAGGYSEGPQHNVAFAQQFAVGRFAVTFEEWDACVADGSCNGWKPPDEGWGRGRRPVINVSWADAKAYSGWLSKKTGKTYRVLSEAEREYATRAGTTTAYSWGNEIGRGNANCSGCGSPWDGRQTAPVGSFKPNAFGLYDMHGNVWEWVEDCYHDNYKGAPADGSAWTIGDCVRRRLRGGSWRDDPQNLRSASRNWVAAGDRSYFLGFRVGRTLSP